MSFVVNPRPASAVPVTDPEGGSFPVRRIYCVGRNYVEHAIEMGHTGREAPFFFLKPADCVLADPHGHAVQMNYPAQTKSLHHEVELVVAIGKGGMNIDPRQALDHVWGYAVGIDMTRRDLQNESKKLGRPWCTGKGFDQSAPIGAIKPAAKCRLTDATRITLEVNGSVRQDSTIGKLIWSVPEIVSHVSTFWELAPGDLIFTGTPEGVNAVERGDILTAEVEGIGRLRVQIV